MSWEDESQLKAGQRLVDEFIRVINAERAPLGLSVGALLCVVCGIAVETNLPLEDFLASVERIYNKTLLQQEGPNVIRRIIKQRNQEQKYEAKS